MGRNFDNEQSNSTYSKKATQLASFEKEINPPEHIKLEYERKKVISSIKKVKATSSKRTLAKSVPTRPFPQKEKRAKREKASKATKRKKAQNKTTNKKKRVNATTKKRPVSAKKMQAMATYYNRMIRRYTIISLVFLLVSTCGFVFFATQFQKATVIGKSMEPTLYPNDKVLYQKRAKLKRFDLVVFPPTKESKELYVKRIIGMPGESVRYKDDVLYVDDLAIEEPYLEGILSTLDTTTSQNYTKDFSLSDIPNVNQESNTIPEGYYLLLGDNRNNSTDSRTIGLISKDLIQGVVRFRYSPLSRLGLL